MPTNRIELKTAEEFMTGYTPIYQPIYPLFLEGARQHASEVGNLDFKRVSTVGDIRTKRVTPKDTEIKQIQVAVEKKGFKKYFLANQFVQSQSQNRDGVEDVVARVLDEHQAQFDEMFLYSEESLNNGLFNSSDRDYVLEASSEITSANRLNNLYTKILATVEEASKLGGQKVLMLYGETVIENYNGLFSGSDRPFSAVLKEAFDADVSIVKIPKNITVSGTNGWLVANLAQTQMHYTKLPELLAQGYNEEKMYYWHNFMLGSSMLELKARGAVIRQPVTFEV